jgi:acyl transferase domain-containing protein/SAM-dependent methyltransferase
MAPEGRKRMPDSQHTSPAVVAELSPVKRALHEIRTLRTRVEELESSQHAPIAIIGAGIRFPGGAIDADSFWNLLAEGRDAITEIPRDRWDWRAYFNADADAPGSMYTQHGGFLTGVDQFDAAFFGISPREAAAMDPQHRLALEVAWEALENSGYSPATLQGALVGIYLGIANNDYGRAALADLENIDAYTGSGNSSAMVAGRLSYVLGLHGPSLAVDTSCSSSLVAVHLAYASLRSGECNLALAGGVNLILSPESNIALSKAHMMARDGRCKTFDDAADGYVRSEGCGIIVLKKLANAMADGDRVLAVIRGSAVNHDGHSGGLTAPNGPAQAAVIRAALEDSRVKAAQIGYVEAHGTGTSLGDPIEVETLASVVAGGRSQNDPLAIGSVKTNIGHLEGASGIAGLMKVVLALEHQAIPPSLHLKNKNSHIPWDRMSIDVPTQLAAWKPLDEHRFAGVSSFGFSGTNAHVVLQEAPVRRQIPDDHERPVDALAISAKTKTALDVLCARYAAALQMTADYALRDFCFTANTGRSHFDHRILVIGKTPEQMASALRPVQAENVMLPSATVHRGIAEAPEEERRICFLFTGQGSQYWGMGRELYESSPVFREAMDRCAVAWKEETGESLIELLYGTEKEVGESRLKQARYAQPALFAVEYALAEMWRSWGIEPSVVLGHSLGEYVAAVIAGVFSLEDGLRLVCARARLMDRLTEKGAMLSIAATPERVQREIAGLENEVGIGVINGAETVVLSGRTETVAQVGKRLEAEGIRTRALEVTHAFHSPLLEPILEEFEACAAKVQYHSPRIRIISNLTGKTARAEEITTPRYWREHMRSTVQFHAGLQAALETGCQIVLEIGPQPHLKALAIRSDASLESRVYSSLRRRNNEWGDVLDTLAKFYVQGYAIDWQGFDRGHRRVRLALPTYPFDRQRYWHAAGNGDLSRRIWQGATNAALAQSNLVPIGVHLESFAAKWEALQRWSVAKISQTLRSVGAFAQPGTRCDAQSLVASCGILPANTKLVNRWLRVLHSAGYLQAYGSQFECSAEFPDLDTTQSWRDVEQCLKDDPYLLEYLANCSRHLRAVLMGTVSPLETLFPAGSPDLARNVYEKSSGARYANLIVAAAVQAAANASTAPPRLRILELGAGTGATTDAVLRALSPVRTVYHFTDVSELFLHHAKGRFSSFPFVRYGVLDIENEEHIARQRGSFDVVIAANVVHTTRDIAATLAAIARLLVPGGTLILLEINQEQAWHEITTGLLQGWQKSEDILHQPRTLLEVEEWNAALRTAGFEEVTSAPEPGSPAEIVGLHVILARNSGVQAEIAAVNLPATENTGASSNVVERTSNPAEAAAFASAFQQALPAEHRTLLIELVSSQIAKILQLDSVALPRKRDRLVDLGMDSLMAVELRNRLSTLLSVDDLPATLIFDYPTPDAIAGYLLDRLQERQEQKPESSVMQNTQRMSVQEVEELSDEAVAELLRERLAR